MNRLLSNLMFWSCLSQFLPIIFISFGIQYSEIYIMRRITEQEFAIKTILGNIFGVLAYFMISQEWMLDFINKHMKKFLVVVLVFYNIGHILIPIHPWVALLVITLNTSLIAKANETVFDDLHNQIFLKRDKTILTARRKMWSMIGVVCGSGLTLVIFHLEIKHVVYIALIGDLIMFAMEMLLYYKIKKIIK